MKKAFSILVILLVLFFISLNVLHAQEHSLVKKWESDTLLKTPESVLFDLENKVLYVSNIDGTDPWAADGKGSIGKVGLDGKIISVDWVPGLNAPKGMGMYKGKLYAADLNSVVVIDIKGAKIVQTIKVDGAEGLNDITVDKKGAVYVSDSKTLKVFKIENGKSEVFLENLKGPNGLLADNDIFSCWTTAGCTKWARIKHSQKLPMVWKVVRTVSSMYPQAIILFLAGAV